MDYLIRKSTIKDVYDITKVITVSWNETYQGMVSQEELDIREAKYKNGSCKDKVAVDKYDLLDNYLCTYNSVKEAANSVNGDSSGITVVAKGKKKSYKGFH